jgi:hypothetical protein
MGRTGTFLAIETYGIQPDYICLSKALGGGLTKIGALMIRRERFVEEFSLKHTSTFAEDDLSCGVALKALELLDRDALPAACESKGQWFLQELRQLCERYPEQLAEARGRGLMVGLELRNQEQSPSNGISMLSQQEFLGYLASSYLLNTHRIRVVPTLSSPLTLRIEPSAYISQADLSRFLDSVGALCDALGKCDFGHLSSFLVRRSPPPVRDYHETRRSRREPCEALCKVGFIGHLLMPHTQRWGSVPAVFDEAGVETLMARPSRVWGPRLFEQVNVRSSTSASVHLNYYGLDVSARADHGCHTLPRCALDSRQHRRGRPHGSRPGLPDCRLRRLHVGRTGNCKRIRVDGVEFDIRQRPRRRRRADHAGGRRGTRNKPSRKRVWRLSGYWKYRLHLRQYDRSGGRGCVLVAREIRSPRLAQVIEEIRANTPGAQIEVTDRMEDLHGAS